MEPVPSRGLVRETAVRYGYGKEERKGCETDGYSY